MPMRESWQNYAVVWGYLIIRTYIHRGEQVANTPESEQIFLSIIIYNLYLYLFIYIYILLFFI